MSALLTAILPQILALLPPTIEWPGLTVTGLQGLVVSEVREVGELEVLTDGLSLATLELTLELINPVVLRFRNDTITSPVRLQLRDVKVEFRTDCSTYVWLRDVDVRYVDVLIPNNRSYPRILWEIRNACRYYLRNHRFVLPVRVEGPFCQWLSR